MQALAHLKVLEMGQLIAGPFCAKTLGDFGAQVIKIESPEGGDPLRKWRVLRNDVSLWWHVQSRNKRSVAIDLRQPEGQAIAKRLAQEADILIENFSPGTLEKWGMGYDTLSALNPRLILVRISGFGQTGPYKQNPGFALIGEAMGGLRHLSGEPGRKPVRVGVSIGDTLAGLHGVVGIFAAIEARHRTGKGQVVDVALSESVLNVMESLIPEYCQGGVVRQPAGSALPGITPSNAYPCTDGLVLVAGNGDGIFKRLMQAIGREDLAQDPDLASNVGRTAQAKLIDDAIEAYTATRTVAEVMATLQNVRVPVGKVYTAQDIAEDPQFLARDMLVTTEAYDGEPVTQPGIIPKLSGTPGEIHQRAPMLGEHTDEVLLGAGFDGAQLAAWRAQGVIR